MLKDLKIGTRLMCAFAITILLMIGLAAFAHGRVASVDRNLTTINDNNSVKQRYAINFRGSVHDRAIALRDVILASTREDGAKAADVIDALAQKYAASAGPLDAMLAPDKHPNDQEIQILASIKETEAQTMPIIQKVIQWEQAGNNDEARSLLMREAAPQFVTWLARINQFIDYQEAANQTIGKETRQETQSFGWLITIWCSVAVALGGLIAWWSINSVKPVSQMADIMERLDEGDDTIRIPAADANNELGKLAKAMMSFRTKLKAAQAASRAAENAQQEQVETIVNSLGEGLTRLADGDMTARITAALDGPFAKLMADFNDASGSLLRLISGVTQTADGIRSGSQEIAQASEDLARRTEGNAASLEETSTALVQIDTRLKATAMSSSQTVSRADQAIATVDGGRATAEDAVAAMGRVSDSAKGIDSVIEGLDKIAFQTRVLAMNAAVEAGRAGDAGRGFAVVADLVSALAMRAEEEAKRARDQLTLTQSDIVTAVQAVQKVDGALATISGDVSEVHKLLGTMANDATAQSSAVTEITAAISAMDKATQQNAAMVEETSAAARNLTAEVNALAAQAAMFKTNDSAGFRPATTKATPVVASGKRNQAMAPRQTPAKPVAALAAAEPAKLEEWAAF